MVTATRACIGPRDIASGGKSRSPLASTVRRGSRCGLVTGRFLLRPPGHDAAGTQAKRSASILAERAVSRAPKGSAPIWSLQDLEPGDRGAAGCGRKKIRVQGFRRLRRGRFQHCLDHGRDRSQDQKLHGASSSNQKANRRRQHGQVDARSGEEGSYGALNEAPKTAQPIQFQANIELVKRYFDKIQDVLQ